MMERLQSHTLDTPPLVPQPPGRKKEKTKLRNDIKTVHFN